MLMRALAIWFVLLAAAIGNGAVRVTWIIPRTGEAAGHVISTLTLSAGILLISCATIGWMQLATVADAWRVGALWVSLTVAFEFLAGHFLFGRTWPELTADYDLLRGRIWVLVLLVTACAPFVAGWLRGLFVASAPG